MSDGISPLQGTDLSRSRIRRPRRHPGSPQQRRAQAQRFESIARLAGGIAHDLNNVFAPIIISGQLLRKTVPGEDEQQCLNVLLGSAWQGTETLRQILAFAGGTGGDFAELQLASTLKEVAGSLRETLGSEIGIELEFPRDLWPLSADSTQLRQALTNVSLNAVDAMTAGGRLFIRAENIMATPAMVRGHEGAKAGSHILITVSDTGHGIPPEFVDRIFDPFFTTKGSEHGRGLGLSVVYGIVRNHRGFIEVHSEVSCGTELELFLPALRR